MTVTFAVWSFIQIACSVLQCALRRFRSTAAHLFHTFDTMILHRVFLCASILIPTTLGRDSLSYVPEPNHVYVPTNDASVETLWELINSREDLSMLAAMLQEPAGR